MCTSYQDVPWGFIQHVGLNRYMSWLYSMVTTNPKKREALQQIPKESLTMGVLEGMFKHEFSNRADKGVYEWLKESPKCLSSILYAVLPSGDQLYGAMDPEVLQIVLGNKRVDVMKEKRRSSSSFKLNFDFKSMDDNKQTILSIMEGLKNHVMDPNVVNHMMISDMEWKDGLFVTVDANTLDASKNYQKAGPNRLIEGLIRYTTLGSLYPTGWKKRSELLNEVYADIPKRAPKGPTPHPADRLKFTMPDVPTLSNQSSFFDIISPDEVQSVKQYVGDWELSLPEYILWYDQWFDVNDRSRNRVLKHHNWSDAMVTSLLRYLEWLGRYTVAIVLKNAYSPTIYTIRALEHFVVQFNNGFEVKIPKAEIEDILVKEKRSDNTWVLHSFVGPEMLDHLKTWTNKTIKYSEYLIDKDDWYTIREEANLPDDLTTTPYQIWYLWRFYETKNMIPNQGVLEKAIQQWTSNKTMAAFLNRLKTAPVKRSNSQPLPI